MFKQRLLTTLILIPLVFLGIYLSNNVMFLSILLSLLLLCTGEAFSLIPIKTEAYKLLYVGFLLILILLALKYIFLFYGLGFVAWFCAFFLIVFYPRMDKLLRPLSVALLLSLFLSLFVASLYLLVQAPEGKSLLVYLLLIVWASDIGAYLAGKLWGSHRLIPAVSPGKTWEGFSGGLIASQVVAFCAYFIFNPSSIRRWFISASVIFVVALIGDLFISLLKRRVKIKDTGSLLPGHGGILDRLDSLIAAAPFFYCLFISGS